SGGGGSQPPDLEELLRRSQERVKNLFPGGGSGGLRPRRGVAVVGLIGGGLWLISGSYRGLPGGQGGQLRFGPVHSVTGPGLHIWWPAPIGEVLTPQVTRVNRVEVGFRSAGQGTGRATGSREIADEALILTGDENIIDVNFVVLWRIADAAAFLFNVRDP